MEEFLTHPGEKETNLSWLQDGATRERYEKIKHIYENSCVTCHSPDHFLWKRPLTRFEEVEHVTLVDRGESISFWARVAHTHLMSLAVVFLCLSIIISFCGVGQKMKAFFMPLPFLALFLDFGARALIKYVPSFVYVMAAAGALMGLSMMVLTLGPLYDMWIRGRKVSNKS